MKEIHLILQQYPDMVQIYDQGYEAYLENDRLEINPYPKEDEYGPNLDFLVWERGYLEAWKAATDEQRL